jgi:hypothetical protein
MGRSDRFGDDNRCSDHIVQNGRAKTSIDKIQQKLKMIKQYFKGWGLNLQSELRKKRASISAELSELRKLRKKGGWKQNSFLKKLN